MQSQRQRRVLAVIPARGGSKGLPKKNISSLAGRPLIAYTIDAALQARLLDRTIVSTEDPRIAEVARRCGADTPFQRPPKLAQDDTPGIDPILHAVRWLAEHEGYCPDYVICLQPTSPLRIAEDIDNSITLVLEKDADGVVSLCEAKEHPYWTKRVTEDGKVVDFTPLDKAYNRRQDLPPVYALNGAIYLARRDVLLEQQTFYTDHTYAYIMPIERGLDIDTPWDLYLAELLLKGGPYQKGA